MKIMQFFSDPLIQVISFSVILVGSPYFGGPYIFFLYHAISESLFFAILGMLAIPVTLASKFMHAKGYTQLVGLILMIGSLIVFFVSGGFRNAYAFRDTIPLLTLLIFVVVAVLIVRKAVLKRSDVNR